MPSASAIAIESALAGNVLLPDSIENLHATYKNAQPFPHVVIDNLFSTRLLDEVLAEAPRLMAEQWVNIEQEGLEKIVRMRSAIELGDAGNRLLSVLHSAAFQYLLSEITGIWQLLPDPYLQGGGHALMRRGGYFKIHADRNVAYDTGLTRRLALIIFLNRNWPPEYGGQLELWDPQAKGCVTSIEPTYNKTILFEVAHPNYHGVPTPLSCPPERMRQSFLVYYHTVSSGNDRLKPHTSLWAPGFYRKKKSVLRKFADQVTPPIVLHLARKLIGPKKT